MPESYYIARAARLERTIGPWAARRYMQRNVRPCNWSLFTIARVLARCELAGI